MAKVFYFKYDSNTGDGLGKGWTFDLARQSMVDTSGSFVEINSDQYMQLQPSLCFYEGGQILPKTELFPILTKDRIFDVEDSTILSWETKEPLHVLTNGCFKPDEKHIEAVEISAARTGPHKFQLFSSRFYSKPVTVTVEAREKDSHTDN